MRSRLCLHFVVETFIPRCCYVTFVSVNNNEIILIIVWCKIFPREKKKLELFYLNVNIKYLESSFFKKPWVHFITSSIVEWSSLHCQFKCIDKCKTYLKVVCGKIQDLCLPLTKSGFQNPRSLPFWIKKIRNGIYWKEFMNWID